MNLLHGLRGRCKFPQNFQLIPLDQASEMYSAMVPEAARTEQTMTTSGQTKKMMNLWRGTSADLGKGKSACLRLVTKRRSTSLRLH